MNRYAKNSFSKIKGACSSYQRDVTEALQAYRAAMDKATKEAAAYKNEDEYIKAHQQAAVQTAKATIAAAEKTLCDIIKAEIKPLKEEFSAHILNRPTPAFTETLRFYRDFELVPTETETRALLDMAGGVTLALRGLNATLEKVNSPLRVKFPDSTEFEKDINELEQFANGGIKWSTKDYHKELCALYANTPRERVRADGTRFNDGSAWTSVSLLTASGFFERSVKALDATQSKWTESIIPTLYRTELYPDTTDKDGNNRPGAASYVDDRTATAKAATIKPSATKGVEQAQKMGHARAEADARAREVMNQYKA